MKKVLLLAVFMVFVTWSQSYADYSLNFTDISGSGAWSVTGDLITTSNGNGTFTVTGGSVTGDGTADNGVIYSLYTPVPSSGSIRPFGATDLIFDNQLMPGSSPVLTGNGLVFEASNGLSYLNIWGNGPGSYTLFQLGYNTSTLSEIYGPADNGTASITPLTASPTPIPAAAWLFGSGLAGLIGLKRKYLG